MNSTVDRNSRNDTTPEWDLSDLYNGSTDPEIDKALSDAENLAEEFSACYKGKLSNLTGHEFATAIKSYEHLSEVLNRVSSFSDLIFSTNIEDTAISSLWQNINERVTLISALVLFFELEINKLENNILLALLKWPEVAPYKSWLEVVRINKPYQLSDDLEKIIHEKSVSGRAAWSRLFDETMAGLKFLVENKCYNSSDILNMISDKDPSTRKKAAKAFAGGLHKNIRLFSLITNTLAKDKEIEDRWRELPHPISARNLGNQVEDEVVDALRQAVRGSYSELSHRYYKLKAGWLGLDFLNYWDRNAPLPEANNLRISWETAKETVLNSYQEFEPRLAEIAKMFFDKQWIHAKPKQGKDAGAYSHPTVPSVHPYILLNFHGKPHDVMTLAHELGHGIHQILAADQGYLLAQTPLTLAETASVFGEMLTFQSLLRSAENHSARKVLLASKVEDMLNTVVRQISFMEFEELVHLERRHGELDPNRLGAIWMSVQKDSLGAAFRLEDEYKNFWAYIPHFVHSPFYVYSYAFGECLVNSLYNLYLQGFPAFQNKYVQLLQAGGSLKYNELLALFGLDASDPQFWKRGLKVISKMIDDLENL